MLVDKIVKNTQRLLIFCVMLLCCSCTADRAPHKEGLSDSAKEYINIEKDKKIPLPFIGFTETIQLKQILTADYNGRSNSLLCIVKLSPNGVALTGLTLSSMPLFNLKYENNTLEGKYYVPKSMLPPVGQVLFDIMLSFDKNNLLSEKLSKEYLIQRDDNRATLRKIDGKEIYRIEYTLSDQRLLPVKIVNNEFNYSLTIKYLKQ